MSTFSASDPQKKERLQEEMTFGGMASGRTRPKQSERSASPEKEPDRFDEGMKTHSPIQCVETRKSVVVFQ